MVEPAACALESIFATPRSIGVDDEGRHLMRGGIQPGGRTLIIGSGTLAMIYGQLAKAEGAGEVWFQVRSQEKADLMTSVLGSQIKVKIVEDYNHLSETDKMNREQELENSYTDETSGELFDDLVLACPSEDAQRLLFRLLNPDGYSVLALFAGLFKLSDQTNVDLLHYRIGKAFGTSGCSTAAMITLLKWLASGKLSLKGFSCPEKYTLDTDPAEFLTTEADGRKPLLYPNA
jgi:threonine dehydrogenase-like Zn-dependent dehydrogenase